MKKKQRETDLRGSKQGDNYHSKIHPSIGKLSECVVLINLLHDFQLLLCMICTIHLQVNLHIQCTSATIQEQLFAVKLSQKEPWSLMQLSSARLHLQHKKICHKHCQNSKSMSRH